MKKLAEVLTKNPLIIVFMFFFTILGTLIGILVSWDVLYRDYLSKSVTIPLWLALLISVIVFFGWIFYATRKRAQLELPMELVADKDFGVERVKACGRKFINCKFNGTEILIDGQSELGFENCKFNGPRFTFVGGAGRTIAILTGMYKDPSFRPMIDKTIDNLKSGNLPVSTAPSSL